MGTPLARTILGPVENINSITADDITRYIKTHYTAPRMVLAAAGAVDHDQIVDLAGRYFGSVPTVAPVGYEYEDRASLFTGSDVRDFKEDAPHAHFALAFEGALGARSRACRTRAAHAQWKLAPCSPSRVGQRRLITCSLPPARSRPLARAG